MFCLDAAVSWVLSCHAALATKTCRQVHGLAGFLADISADIGLALVFVVLILSRNGGRADLEVHSQHLPGCLVHPG